VIESGGVLDRGSTPVVAADIIARAAGTGAEGEVFRTTTDPAGLQRLVGIRTIHPARLRMDNCLTIVVSRDLHAVFPEWRHNVLVYGGLYLLLVVVGGSGVLVIRKRRQYMEMAEARLFEAREILENFFAITPDLLCIADLGGDFRQLNPSWEKVLGYPLAEMEGTPFIGYLHPEDVEPTLAAMSDLAAGKDVIGFVNRFRHRDGSYRHIEWRSAARGDLIFASARDVSERKEAELRLKYLAYHDRLTGLANRSLLFGRLSHSLSAAGRNHTRVATLFIDLDGFKEINDRYGHEGGDIVLKTVAGRFQSAVRASDTVPGSGGMSSLSFSPTSPKPPRWDLLPTSCWLRSKPRSLWPRAGHAGSGPASASACIRATAGRWTNCSRRLTTRCTSPRNQAENRYQFSQSAPSAASADDDRIVLGEAYLLGIGELDEQHRKMTELVNLLIDAVRTDAGDDRTSRLLNELIDCTTSHFNTERELMERFDYPERATHNASHDYLLVEIADFGEQLAQQGKLFMVKLVRDWLLQHIDREDRPLGRFLRERMADNHSERITSDGC